MVTAFHHSSGCENDGRGLPRLSGSFLGNGYRWLKNPYALLDRGLAEHGQSFYARLPVLGKVLITGAADEIQAIVKCRELVGGRGLRALRPILGDQALITLEGGDHTRRRKMLGAAFNRQSVQRVDDLIMEACRREIEQLPRHEPISILQVAHRITLHSIIRILFGRLDPAREEQLCDLIDNFMTSFKNPLFLFVEPLQRDWGPLSPWGRLSRHRERLRNFVDEEIKCRPKSGYPLGDSVLCRLLAAATSAEEKLTAEVIFNEILSLLLFGHDTSSMSLSWLFYHVYSHAPVLDRLRNEVSAQAGAGEKADLGNRSYLRCCIMESLRLCPVVVHLTRVATRDLRLGRHSLKTGDKVLPSAYLAQHDPTVFPDPFRFEPERFANGQNYGHGYFPFGFGKRKCIGEHLALRQMQLMLYCFVKFAELELEPNYRATAARKLLLIGPADGSLMRVCG